jgi:hypothetical protein
VNPNEIDKTNNSYHSHRMTVDLCSKKRCYKVGGALSESEEHARKRHAHSESDGRIR